jgi:hypothetical protein
MMKINTDATILQINAQSPDYSVGYPADGTRSYSKRLNLKASKVPEKKGKAQF